MTQKKAAKPRINLPVGIARYPHLNTPDTKYNPLGEYKVDVAFDSLSEIQDEVKRLTAILNDYAEQEGIAPDNINPVYAETADGKFVLRCKQKAFEYKGEVVLPEVRFHDARGAYMGNKNLPVIKGGSRIAMAVEVWPYTTQDTVREGGRRIVVKACGLTLKPKAVQIIELAAGGAGSADYGFGSYEGGYVAENQQFAEYDAPTPAQAQADDADRDF